MINCLYIYIYIFTYRYIKYLRKCIYSMINYWLINQSINQSNTKLLFFLYSINQSIIYKHLENSINSYLSCMFLKKFLTQEWTYYVTNCTCCSTSPAPARILSFSLPPVLSSASLSHELDTAIQSVISEKRKRRILGRFSWNVW